MSTFKRFLRPDIDISLGQYTANATAHLPVMMRQDIDLKVGIRKGRNNASDRNLSLYVDECVRHAEKLARHITSKFPFGVLNLEPKQLQLTHEIIMSDELTKEFAMTLVAAFESIIDGVEIEEKERIIDTGDVSHTGFLGAILKVYEEIRLIMLAAYIEPPFVDISEIGHKLAIEDAEDILECAVKKCVDPKYLVKKFRCLRKRYIEHSQVTIGNVGKRHGQNKYVSRLTLSNFKQKMRESQEFMENMVVISHETMQEHNLAEVAKRTTANLENRRVELIVRCRGDEERAIDFGYEGVFITWTLPSKYHRNSYKWNGCTVKESHNALMKKWRLARAHFAKERISWFGLRVAEPHGDGTPHLHAFVYCRSEDKAKLMSICAKIARSEDNEELRTKKEKKARFHAKPCDPSKGTATGYIIKYISKNINGAHMPEGNAGDIAVSVRAWASAWGIKQFSQSGSPAVGLWRQLRRAKKEDVNIDEELMNLHEHADKSRWNHFCQNIGDAKLAYEYQQNQYGETTKRVIGFSWLGQLIETCSEHFSLVAKCDVKAWKEQRGGAPSWSTENKCNQPLEKPLMDLTGWSLRGVQCLIAPLMRGAKIQIDRYTSVSFKNNRLIVF